MSCTNHQPQLAEPEPDQADSACKASISESAIESSELPQNPNHDSGLNPDFEDVGWGYCTEEQLEEILLKNLELLFTEAISKIVMLGYNEECALKAMLTNGHCFGDSDDVLTNVMNNCISYLNDGPSGSDGSSEGNRAAFNDLKQLKEYSLVGMVCLLQQVNPHWSRGDAMWCLLMSDLHVRRASLMDLPVCPSPCSTNGCGCLASNNVERVDNTSNDLTGNRVLVNDSEMSMQEEIQCPGRFNLTSSLKSLLSRNAALLAEGFRANAEDLQMQSPSDQYENEKNQDVDDGMLENFQDINIDGIVLEDKKDEMILSLINQIKDLEKQVEERKEWAQNKAIQAARKLCNDQIELKKLRMEREENQQLKQAKPTPEEDPTMKRLSEMESALRKASGQVDRANAAVRRLEMENAEIRAEIEASNLSASESVTNCLEVSKREKKCMKKLLAWEKQKTKMQEEIAAEKQKISELQQQMLEVEAAKKDAEEKLRREKKAKELAAALAEEEERLKEAAEASIKRRRETLRLKIEIDFQRYKDDLQRLELEFSHLKVSTESTQQQPNNSLAAETPGGDGETIARLLDELNILEDYPEKATAGNDRACIICREDEVSVVFLPCAHQVVCVNCNDECVENGRSTCPYCSDPIEERIRVFGAASS